MGKIKFWAGRLDLRIGGMASAFADAFWNRILAVAAPGIATGDAFDSEPGTFEGPVGLDGFDEILRAGRNVAATGTRTSQFVYDWGKKNLVKPHQFDKNPFHVAGSRGASRESFPMRYFHSDSMAENVTPTAAGRGMVTTRPDLITSGAM